MPGQKALFLDRDGIINIDHGYVYSVKDFEFTKGIFALCSLFQNTGYTIFVVTNQSGIARGYYTEDDFNRLTEWMILEFQQKGIIITKVYHCPHLPDQNCICRKPSNGMIKQAASEYQIDFAHSWLIGDKQSDIDLANNMNIQNSISIGHRHIINSTFHFQTIEECLVFLQENKDTIK